MGFYPADNKRGRIEQVNLLPVIQNIFNRDIKIIPYDSISIDKCLVGNIKTEDIFIQIKTSNPYNNLANVCSNKQLGECMRPVFNSVSKGFLNGVFTLLMPLTHAS